ncbi:MAG: diacylglycerol kinase family protein [Bacteroidales bacterium]|nr:diacylglycerol kinase family protein [Bacteroidales bacterium]
MGKVIKHNFFTSRKQSYNHAIIGIKLLFKTQTNFRIEVICALLVVIFAFFLKLIIIEWCLILISIFFVFITEALNTALEFVSDEITEEHNVLIRNAKDISAGAVLLSVISSIIVGLLIFIPKIIALIS